MASLLSFVLPKNSFLNEELVILLTKQQTCDPVYFSKC